MDAPQTGLYPYVAESKLVFLHSFDARRLADGSYEWFEPTNFIRKLNYESDMIRVTCERFHSRLNWLNRINEFNNKLNVYLTATPITQQGEQVPGAQSDTRVTTATIPEGTYFDRNNLARSMEEAVTVAVNELFTSGILQGDEQPPADVRTTVRIMDGSGTIKNNVDPFTRYEFELPDATPSYPAPVANYLQKHGATERAFIRVNFTYPFDTDPSGNPVYSRMFQLSFGEFTEQPQGDTIWGAAVYREGIDFGIPPATINFGTGIISNNRLMALYELEQKLQSTPEVPEGVEYQGDFLTPNRPMLFSQNHLYLRMLQMNADNLESQYLASGLRSFEIDPTCCSMTNGNILAVAPLNGEVAEFVAQTGSGPTYHNGYFYLTPLTDIQRLRFRITNERNESISIPDSRDKGPIPFEIHLRLDVLRNPEAEKIAGSKVTDTSRATKPHVKRFRTGFEQNDPFYGYQGAPV